MTGEDGGAGADAASEDLLGISGYTDYTEIGRGGFATVYRARRPAFAQTVAIKVLTGSELDDTARARFDRERTAMGALAQHPYIVTVYDGGVAATGHAYLIMEFLPRGSLHDRLRRAGPLPLPVVLETGVKLAGALETAHRAGVLHRDIKPANILLSPYGEPLLADFGIARIAGSAVTASGVVTASLSHAPPEVLDSRPSSTAGDVYSLASTLFCMLTGSAPFVRESDDSLVPLLARVIREPVPDLRPAGVPAPMCAALERAMAKDPRHRPPSALAFGEELRRVQDQLGLPPSPLVVEGVDAAVSGPVAQASSPPPGNDARAPAPPGRRRPLVALAVAVSLVLVLVIALLALRTAPPPTGLAPVEGPSLPPSTAPQTTTATTVPAGVGELAGDLDDVLLDLREFDPDGARSDNPPATGIATVLRCLRPANDSGKLQEVKRTFSTVGGDLTYFDTYVARFAQGRAADFMASVRTTAASCTQTDGSTARPAEINPPQGGDDATRVTSAQEDGVWVRRGDYVVAVTARFGVGKPVDPVAAPDVAARTIAKLVAATS